LKILVLNSGSSSLKHQLFDMRDRGVLEGGAGDPIVDRADAVRRLSGILSDTPAAPGDAGLFGIGHRVVHGGESFREPVRVDRDVVEEIRKLGALAPLHNPTNLLGIEVALERRPDVPQVAVFDTAFHQTIPPRAHRYAIPHDWYASHRVRRYGFHGSSHAYVARQAAALLGRPQTELNLIVLHLGNGASATAIEAGRSIDTSMGLTPLEGLVMGTRSGDLDPAVIFHVARQSGQSLDELDAALTQDSGLEGLCGAADMRDVLARQETGDARAALAVDVYTYRIRKYIGAYTAVLGRVDALAFTGGVGENSPAIRARACEGLTGLGIELDPKENLAAGDAARPIHAEGSRVRVLVVPTHEELEIAEQTLRCIREG
jgi:acetate kinase